VTVCPAPNAQDSDQLLMAVPRLLMSTLAPNPPCHCELIE
jgi:hypothetical protein